MSDGAAVREHLEEHEAVRERLDAQLGQQGGLRTSDLLALLDQVDVRHNFDGTPVNLGGNVQGLHGTAHISPHTTG